MPIDKQLRWTNPVSFEGKNDQLADVQDFKGTPFENFLSDLSTNEKPAFWALDQWEGSIYARFLVWVLSGVYQYNANAPIDYQLIVNLIPIVIQSNTNRVPIDLQSLINSTRCCSD